MSRLGLTGRLILLIAVGMLIVQIVTFVVYLNDRAESLPGRQLVPAADQMEATVALFDGAAAEERDLLIRALAGSGLILQNGADLDRQTEDRQVLATLTEKLREYSDLLNEREVLLTVPENPFLQWLPAWRATISPSRIQMLVRLSDGTWLTLDRRPTPGLSFAGLPFGIGSAMLATLVSVIAMVVVWRETRPLRRLAEATKAFGRNLEPQSLPVARARDLGALVLAFDDMQHRIARADRNRTDMLVALSHDVRTPLTRLRLRLRKLDPGLQEAAARDISQIERVADAAFQLTQAGSQSLNDTIDLRALLAELAEEADLPFTDHAPGLPSQVRGNSQLLGRAIANLIDNALKYGTSARVVLSPGRDKHAVAIEDDGPGIPVEDRQRLLQAFQRGDVARGGTIEGNGLGLALARRIVSRHGGRLTLGDAPSGGLSASFTLPTLR